MEDCIPTVVEAGSCPEVIVEQCGNPGPPGPPGPSGGVTAPPTVINQAIPLWDGTDGSKLKDSGVLLSMLATVAQLAGKVDAVPGMGLSEANFTNAEKNQLASLVLSAGGNFVGTYPDLITLQAIHPTAPEGSYAYVTDTGLDQQFYAWDNVNGQWVTTHALDGPAIASLLFAQSNTNNFTDIHKAIVEDAVTQATLDALINNLATEIGLLVNNVVTEATTSRQLALTDIGKYIRLTNVSGCNIIVPEQAVVDWQDAPLIKFRVATSGPISITPGSGVTVHNGTAVAGLSEHDNFSLKRINNDAWDLIIGGG